MNALKMSLAVEGKSATRKRANKSPLTTSTGVPSRPQHVGVHSPLANDSEDQTRPPSKRPRLLKGLNTNNVLETPSKPISVRQRLASLDGASPVSGGLARTSTRERGKVNYDMRYHPAGKCL